MVSFIKVTIWKYKQFLISKQHFNKYSCSLELFIWLNNPIFKNCYFLPEKNL
jgi:hypothetical protein